MLSPDDQYAANMATLARQPAMAGLVAQMAQMPLTNLQLLPGPTGHLTGCAWDVGSQSWLPLCDLQDPVGAAQQITAQMWSPNQTIYTLIGLGLGYAVAALAKHLLSYQRLVIWDMEGAFFKAMLYALDINDVFAGKRVEIYVGPDILSKIEPWYMSLEVHEKLHMALPANHSYTAVYRHTEYEALTTQCMEMLRFHMVGLATWRQFGRCIGDNDIANMPEYYQTPGMATLTDLWKDKPAVCVAAGPSLQKNLRLLLPPAVRSQIALLTVGTTYALLQGLGLQPDIVTTIDFQRLNWTDQFQHVPLDPDCTLVYLHSTYPQTVRRWPGPCFVAENASDTMSWIKQYVDVEKGQAGMVQTVAHLNLLVALTIGANPIILLGQDLSMPATEHHAAGARAQDAAPADVAPEAFLDVLDMHGKPTKTRHSFASMLLVFERLIAQHPETTFLNASEQGMTIKGAEHLPLTQVLQRILPSGSPPLPATVVTPLRATLKRHHAAQHPQAKETLPDAFQTLCREVAAIGDWATATEDTWEGVLQRTLSPDAHHAALSADVWSDQQTRDLLNFETYQAIVASEKVLQDRPHATGMFVIRRFDFIELKGAIPPPPATLTEPWQVARYTADRLVAAAHMFREELPMIQRLLRTAGKRLRPGFNIARAMAQQRTRHALDRFRIYAHEHKPQGLPVNSMRIFAQLLRHTQQYDAALALMDTWEQFATTTTSGTAQHAARIRRHLTAYHAAIREAMPVYFQEKPAVPVQEPLRQWDVPALSVGAILLGMRDLSLGIAWPATRSAINGVTMNGHATVPAPMQDAAGYLVHGEEGETDAGYQ